MERLTLSCPLPSHVLYFLHLSIPRLPLSPSLDSHISSRQLTGSLPLWPFFSLISRPLRLLSCSRFNASSDSDSRCRQTPGTAADRFHVLQITGLIFPSSAPNPFFENIFLRPPPCPAPPRCAVLCSPSPVSFWKLWIFCLALVSWSSRERSLPAAMDPASAWPSGILAEKRDKRRLKLYYSVDFF